VVQLGTLSGPLGVVANCMCFIHLQLSEAKSKTFLEQIKYKISFWDSRVVLRKYGNNNHVLKSGLAKLATDLLPRVRASARMTPLP
jgi:hypothetical protein